MKKKMYTQTEEPSKKEPGIIDDHDFSDSCFSGSICSFQDCTGLIPALPSSAVEQDAYEEMYRFCLTPAIRQKKEDTGRQD